MFVRDLSISASTQAQFPEGFDARDFNLSTAHIVEILISLLPYRTINFDNISKLNVLLGDNPREEYERGLDGIAIVSDKSFDFVDYFSLSGSERERLVMKCFKRALLRIEEIVGVDATELIEVAGKVEAANFRKKVYPRKLARSTKSRKHRLHVFIDIHPYYESWGVDVKDKRGQIVRSIKLYKNTFFGISDAALKKTRWRGNVFQIVNCNDRVIHEIDTSEMGLL